LGEDIEVGIMKQAQFDKMKVELQKAEAGFLAGAIPRVEWRGFDPRTNSSVIENKSWQRSVLLTYCTAARLSCSFEGSSAMEVGVEKHRSVCMALGLKKWSRMDRIDDVGGNRIDFVTDFVEDGVPEGAIDAFDLVVCSNTLEHTFDIGKGFDSVFSMAKNAAVLYFSLPFMLGEHGDGHDYWRMTPACMGKMMEGRARDYVVLREQVGDKLLGVSCFALK